MILLPFALIFMGYTLGWYGYGTIEQAATKPKLKFSDYLLPTHIGNVDKVISSNWGKGGFISSANQADISNAQSQLANPSTTPNAVAGGSSNNGVPNFFGPGTNIGGK